MHNPLDHSLISSFHENSHRTTDYENVSSFSLNRFGLVHLRSCKRLSFLEECFGLYSIPFFRTCHFLEDSLNMSGAELVDLFKKMVWCLLFFFCTFSQPLPSLALLCNSFQHASLASFFRIVQTKQKMSFDSSDII